MLTGSGVRERVVFEDSLVGSQHIVNASGIPEQACHVSLAFTPDRLILLAFQGQRATDPDLHVRILHTLFTCAVLMQRNTGPALRCMSTSRCIDFRVAICLVLSIDVTVNRCVIAGVRSARLLSWQERLAALRELLLWDHALWLGLRIYTAAQPHHNKVFLSQVSWQYVSMFVLIN